MARCTVVGAIIGFFPIICCGFHIDVVIRYPDEHSAVKACGLKFLATTSLNGYDKPVPATRLGPDSYNASIELPNHFLYSTAHLSVYAQPWNVTYNTSKCMAVCPKLGLQGLLGQIGPFYQTEVLLHSTVVEVWPEFCGTWSTAKSSFYSQALKRHVMLTARLPATVNQNLLPRPSSMLPPIMFRLNPEWYFNVPSNNEVFDTWHSLMMDGVMQPVTMVEIYIENVTFESWADQPIFSMEPLEEKCGHCEPEFEFICESWNGKGQEVAEFVNGSHHFGTAAAFFDELYDVGLPLVQRSLPAQIDDKPLQVGMWGYCIGGLAALNALTYRPDRFNIAYLGSPAIDFNCGEPIRRISSLQWSSAPPRVYIDWGQAESAFARVDMLLLANKFRARGLVDGRDLFVAEAEFGTHAEGMILRRSLKALLTLFGSGGIGTSVYAPVVQRSTPTAWILTSNFTAVPESSDSSIVDSAVGGFAVAAMLVGFVAIRTRWRGHHTLAESLLS